MKSILSLGNLVKPVHDYITKRHSEEARVLLYIMLVSTIFWVVLSLLPAWVVKYVFTLIMNALLIVTALSYCWHRLFGNASFFWPLYFVIWKVTRSARFKMLYEFHKGVDDERNK